MARGYKTDCPQCGGDNLYVTPDNDVSYCFNCGYRSTPTKSDNDQDSTVSFAKDSAELLEIREFYTVVSKYYHSCLDGAALRYALSRGISEESIEKYCIGYCPESDRHGRFSADLGIRSGLYNSAHSPVLAGRLTFPYFNPISGEVVDIRARSVDNSDPKYKGPFGGTAARGASEWPYNANSLATDHLITEGEIKTIVAAQFGFSTVGVPGISTWRWRIRTMSKGSQTVLFDSQNDPSVRESVNQAIDKLASKIPELKVATLPLGKEKKMDLDTYLLTKGPEELRLVVDKALPYNEWARLLRRPYVLRHGR
jgi:DNA primase